MVFYVMEGMMWCEFDVVGVKLFEVIYDDIVVLIFNLVEIDVVVLFVCLCELG